MITYKLYPDVTIGPNAQINDYVIIGVPPRGKSEGELETIIGRDALIRSHTVIYAGNTIGDGFQTGHGVLIRENNRIGNYVSVGSHTVIEHHVMIGDHVRIHSQAFIPEFSVLEDGCWIGPNATLTNARYPLSKRTKESLKGPTIKARAKIGANATLLPGIVVGANALVGAGSVVVNDVPQGKVVAGNPAKVIRDVAALRVYEFEEAL